MNTRKINQIKKNLICDKKRLYLDFTASGLGYKPIEKKIQKVLKTYANTHSKVSHNSEITSEYYAQAHKDLKKTLGLTDEFVVLPAGSGTTGAIKKFQEIVGLYIPPATKKRFGEVKEKPLVLIGPFEHHSNEISYRESFCDVIRIPLNSEKEIDLKYLAQVLEENKKRSEIYGSFSVASNITGLLNPLEKISKLLRKYNAVVAFDSASFSAYGNVDCELYDALFMSPHKLIGGPGASGLLVIKKYLYNTNLAPTFAGGGTVRYVSKSYCFYSENIEEREDAGTPAILQFIKTAEVYNLRNQIGLENIAKHEDQMKKYFFKKIKEVENVEIYTPENKETLSIFSFNIKGINCYDLSEVLSRKFKIETRAGCSCAGPYGHDLLCLEEKFENYLNHNVGWLRVGFFYIHTKKDIDYFISSLKKSIKILTKTK
ncbi:aminotransferase [Candidatus Campbellbacteria bacterium]|nr:MAG: aminotransferase [Candidatus Campbellbacteria bacterium]